MPGISVFGFVKVFFLSLNFFASSLKILMKFALSSTKLELS